MDVIIHIPLILTRTKKEKTTGYAGGFFQIRNFLFNEQQLVGFRVCACVDHA